MFNVSVVARQYACRIFNIARVVNRFFSLSTEEDLKATQLSGFQLFDC